MRMCVHRDAGVVSGRRFSSSGLGSGLLTGSSVGVTTGMAARVGRGCSFVKRYGRGQK